MSSAAKEPQNITAATVRFAGDSGDGMQLAGMRFTDASALLGNDVATLPDYPAEIRAPAGTVAGISGFQVNFAAKDIYTPGDVVDALIAMNPAAFKANIDDVRAGGLVIVNETDFTKGNLTKIGYVDGYNPVEDEEIAGRYKIYKIPISRLTTEALADSELSAKDALRCRNMYVLGLIFWLYDRPLEATIAYLDDYFGKQKKLPEIAAANIKVLKAGYHFGETVRMFTHRFHVAKAAMPPGTYRRVTGNEAIALGLIASSKLAGKSLVYCSYPITPASEILHYLAGRKHFGVKTVQAEDEIAAICAAIGASFAGQIGCTGTSGPGLALKTEALGLAVMTELPLVVVDVQRAGPSTGLPTKTEQGDLLQALWGRSGESPVVVLAARSPADCFDTALEAARLALLHMVPVVLLTDAYLANGAEPWRLPDPDTLEPITVSHPRSDNTVFHPYARDDRLVRPWAVPGTVGLEHRIGGLEAREVTGEVNYEAENHQRMVELRQRKIDLIAQTLPPLEICGLQSGDLLVVGWGSTHGAILSACQAAREEGKRVGSIHLRHLNPLPRDLGSILARFDRILVPELNSGHLRTLLRDRFLVDVRGLNKIQGQPLLIEEIQDAIDMLLDGRWGDRLSVMPSHHLLPEVTPAEGGSTSAQAN